MKIAGKGHTMTVNITYTLKLKRKAELKSFHIGVCE